MKQAFAGLHKEFPDVRVEIESMMAEGDMVAVRLTFSGTHASTGERATWPEIVLRRFSEGKAAESWELTDTGRSWNSPAWKSEEATRGTGGKRDDGATARSSGKQPWPDPFLAAHLARKPRRHSDLKIAPVCEEGSLSWRHSNVRVAAAEASDRLSPRVGRNARSRSRLAGPRSA